MKCYCVTENGKCVPEIPLVRAIYGLSTAAQNTYDNRIEMCRYG